MTNPRTINEMILGLPGGLGQSVQLADGRATLAGLRVGVIPEQVEVRLLLTLREETPALRALMAGGTGEQWEGGDGED